MKTVYLHIGTHRTGSTSIQRFLARAEDALAERGVIYPKTGRPDTEWSNRYGHHVLHWSLVGKHGVTSDRVWKDLEDEISCRKGGRVVLSAEGFEGEGSDEEPHIRRTVEHLAPYPIQVIVYLRPPLQFLTSVYKKRVEMGTWSGSFTSLIDGMSARCNYGALVSRWEHFDRVQSVDIRLFEKVKESPGLEADFAEAIGVSPGELKQFFGTPVNASPPAERIQVVRWINRIGDVGPEGETWQTLTNRARQNVLGRRWPGRWLVRLSRPFLRDTIVTERGADLLRDRLEDVHRHFLEDYIPFEDRKYLRC